jgi:hypothetical protein
MSIEDLKQELRTPIGMPEWKKPRLSAEVMTNPIGKMAIAAVNGTEPPDDLFMLLSNIFVAGLSGTQLVLDGKDFKIEPEATIFVKPYYPKTMKLVEHLVNAGHMKLESGNSRGSMYALVYPKNPAERQDWMTTVLDTARTFFIRETSRDLFSQMPAERKWTKNLVSRVPEEYRKTFPEDVPDCLLCETEKTGVYCGVQRIPDHDPRVPEAARHMNIVFAFGLCPGCYELPDVQAKVLRKIADTDRIV